MIEDRLREAFARNEAQVPDATRLVPLIEAEVRHRRTRRRFLASAAGAGLAVLLVAVGLPALVGDRLTGALTPSLPGHAEAIPTNRAMNFLIAGIDRLPSWRPDEATRADAIIVVHVPADRSAVHLLTIPRDLEVILPPVPDRGFEGGRTKINAAYTFGGFEMLAQTVADLTGLAFDGGAVVQLDGLTGLVDQVGGVPLCVDVHLKSIHTGAVFEPGCRTFTGAQVADYLRQRRGLPDGARDRERHVLQFLVALTRQVVSSGTLDELDRLTAAYRTLRRYVLVDTRAMSPVDLMWQLRGATRTLFAAEVPVAYTGTGNVVQEPAALELFQALRTDALAAWLARHPTAAVSMP
ncbi:MAG TPA: LCP family protein [Micromonosporaceae bacterium]